MNQKPTIPEVLLLVKAWYAKLDNEGGGIFHVILEDGNHEQHWAVKALEDARATGDTDAILLAEKLVAISPTQRRKLANMH